MPPLIAYRSVCLLFFRLRREVVGLSIGECITWMQDVMEARSTGTMCATAAALPSLTLRHTRRAAGIQDDTLLFIYLS
jgi:hypothetical protein